MNWQSKSLNKKRSIQSAIYNTRNYTVTFRAFSFAKGHLFSRTGLNIPQLGLGLKMKKNSEKLCMRMQVPKPGTNFLNTSVPNRISTVLNHKTLKTFFFEQPLTIFRHCLIPNLIQFNRNFCPHKTLHSAPFEKFTGTPPWTPLEAQPQAMAGGGVCPRFLG